MFIRMNKHYIFSDGDTLVDSRLVIFSMKIIKKIYRIPRIKFHIHKVIAIPSGKNRADNIDEAALPNAQPILIFVRETS